MAYRRALLYFFTRFAIAYMVLLLPWPGLDESYARAFRVLGGFVFGQDRAQRVLYFQPVPESSRRTLSTQIFLAKRELPNTEGKIFGKILELDTRGVGWVPTALFVALVFSTPINWKRRGRALVAGGILIHAFILFSVAVYIWNESTDLGLLARSGFWKDILDELEETLVNQLGASFVVPVLIWMEVTFRRADFSGRDLLFQKRASGRLIDPKVTALKPTRAGAKAEL